MEKKERVITIFQNNLHSRLTPELANGMIQAIWQIIQETEKDKQDDSDNSISGS